MPLTGDRSYWGSPILVKVAAVWSADSLPDCTRLVLAELNVVWPDHTDTFPVLARIDPLAGLTTPVVVLPADLGVTFYDVSTDPITQRTYLIGLYQDSPVLSIADLASGSWGGTWVAMPGLVRLLGDHAGIIAGDFDPTGRYWALAQSGGGTQNLISYPARADLPPTTPSKLGELPTDGPGPYVALDTMLAFDDGSVGGSAAGEQPGAALPATGVTPDGALLVGVALVLAGVVIAFVRPFARRTASARG